MQHLLRRCCGRGCGGGGGRAGRSASQCAAIDALPSPPPWGCCARSERCLLAAAVFTQPARVACFASGATAQPGSDSSSGREGREGAQAEARSSAAELKAARLLEARRLMQQAASGSSFSSGDEDGGGGERDSESAGSQGSARGKEEEAYAKALSRAMRLINFRERSARELEGRLLEDGYDAGVAVRVVARMQELGLQDDARYAQMYARGRWRASARAPAQIARELKTKGVQEPHVRAALEAVFGPGGKVQQPDPRYAEDSGGEEGEEEEEYAGVWDQLVQQARRRAELSEGEDVHKRRRKLANWLQYRGHSWDVVKRLMREVGL